MKNLIICFLFFATLSVQAKGYYSAKIVFKDGTTSIGYATLPSNESHKKYVKFKTDQDSKAKKIKNENISRITYTMNNGNKYLFERIGMMKITKNFYQKNKDLCQKAKQKWLLSLLSTNNIVVYNFAQSYVIDKNQNIVSQVFENEGVWTDLFYVFKRPDETCAAIISQRSYGNKIIENEVKFKIAASVYFRGNELLIGRIRRNEFKSENVKSLALAYDMLR